MRCASAPPFSCCCVLLAWPVRDCRQFAEQSHCGFDRRQRLCHTCPRVGALAKCPLEGSLTVPNLSRAAPLQIDVRDVVKAPERDDELLWW